MLYVWRLCCLLPQCPGRLLFYCLCWKGDKHFPPPAATVAPPETTAGGGAASSAPHPLILHPFQASTQSPAWLTPPRQGTRSISELEGMAAIIWSSSLISQLRRWRSRKGNQPTRVAQGVWQSQDTCLPKHTALQGWPMEGPGWEARCEGDKGRLSSQQRPG